MAKPQALDAGDLAPARSRDGASRQRGVVPSAELVPLQLKVSRTFARAFRVAAAQEDMRLNAFVQLCFEAFQEKKKQAS